MIITAGASHFELNTKLGTVKRIEAAFKLPLIEIFKNIAAAETQEMIKLLAIAADRAGGEPFAELRRAIEDNWDYSDLMGAVQELVAKLQFSGTPEQIEAKLERYPADETQKNALRGLLGLPIITPSTGDDWSETHTQ